MRRQETRGFTLLEVLAALLILATAIFAALQIQGQAVGAASQLKKLALAHAAAESALDEFLAAPEFSPSDTTFLSEETVELPGYEQSGLIIRRIITEHTPLEEQESLDVLQEVEPATGGSAATSTSKTSASTQTGTTTQQTDAATTEEEVLPFDPGTFVAIRIEVSDARQPDQPIVALETWLPKPPVEEQVATPTQAAQDTGTATPSGVRTTGTTQQRGQGTGTRTPRGQQPNTPAQGGQGTQPRTPTYLRSGDR